VTNGGERRGATASTNTAAPPASSSSSSSHLLHLEPVGRRSEALECHGPVQLAKPVVVVLKERFGLGCGCVQVVVVAAAAEDSWRVLGTKAKPRCALVLNASTLTRANPKTARTAKPVI